MEINYSPCSKYFSKYLQFMAKQPCVWNR